jgi:hypothetical protein
MSEQYCGRTILRQSVVLRVAKAAAPPASDQVRTDDPTPQRGEMRGQRVKVAALPGQAVDADDDVLGIGWSPFDIGDLVEAGLRQAADIAAPVRLAGRRLTCGWS